MFRDLKPYPECAHTAAGLRPPHWTARSMGSLLRQKSERNRPDLPLLSVARERGVFVRSAGDDNHNVVPDDLTNYKVARKGDLVVNKMKAWQGSMGVAPTDGVVSPAYYVYDLALENAGYAHLLLRSKPYVAHYVAASDGVRIGQWDLSDARFRRIPLSIPPVDEQEAIVTYLAHAHQRINLAIDRKRRLIDLLQEQAGAIIHAGVTSERHEAGPLVPTGKDWFPHLPSGWSAVSLGRVVTQAVDGPHFSPSYVDSGVPFVSARNIRPGRLSFEDAKYVTESDAAEFDRRVVPRKNDVLYTKGGTTGVASVVDTDERFQVWVHVAVLKVRKDLVEPRYLALALNSPYCYEQSQLETRGATNQDLGLGRMKRILLPLPPKGAQTEIVDRVEADLADVNGERGLLERQIALLQEFRTRLTADVITGQVDVRRAVEGLPSIDPAGVFATDCAADPDDEEAAGDEE